MPYRISGRDRVTNKQIPTYVSFADDEGVARAQAQARGIVVDSIETVEAPQRRLAETKAVSPQGMPLRRAATTAPRPARLPGYEFNRVQRRLIGSLAQYMHIASGVAIGFGLLQLLIGFLAGAQRGWASLVQGGVLLLLGFLTRQAAHHFRKIHKSNDKDLTHLMNALARLKTIYAFQVWMFSISILALSILLIYLYTR